MSTATFDVPGLPLPVAVKRMRNARRMRLRVDTHAGLLRLTMPHRLSQRAALLWAGEQHEWVSRQLADAPAATPFVPGAAIPFEGTTLTVEWRQEHRRGTVRDGDRLIVGGPLDSLSRSVENWLKRHARDLLSGETAEIAKLAGVTVRSVSIGDPVSRWGSCSSAGAIRYSWRLVLAPPETRRFVVAHEVAHRLHMNHGADFKAAEERLFGGPVASARARLRELGPALRGVGRGS